MSKVLLITLAWPSKGNTNLYRDLILEFANNGHEVIVITTQENRFGTQSIVEIDNKITVHRIACGNITKTKYIEKTISLIKLNRILIEYDKKKFTPKSFDIILISTPSITLSTVGKKLKKRHNAFMYLLLKDVWPQGSVDLGAIVKYGPVWQFFRWFEKKMYNTVDKIGCMSPYGVDFILKANPSISKDKVEVCPNSIIKKDALIIDKNITLKKYNIPINKTLIIYGGNLSISHGLDFYLECIKYSAQIDDVFFIIIGSGTHFTYTQNFISTHSLKNVKLIEKLPLDEYKKIVECSDIGVIMLNPKYTVPQFPSKLNDYISQSKPVISITNTNTDIGSIIKNHGAGYSISSYDVNDFIKCINEIKSNKELLNTMGKNSLDLFNLYYTTHHSYKIIMDAFTKYKA